MLIPAFIKDRTKNATDILDSFIIRFTVVTVYNSFVMKQKFCSSFAVNWYVFSMNWYVQFFDMTVKIKYDKMKAIKEKEG